MSIQAPQGILNIPNATLRVGKLAVDEVVGADTALNTIARNTILLVDGETYHENKNWDLKLPNAWAGEFECNTASAGNYSEFNFYNEGASSNAQGYNLTFNDTAVQLRYDGALLKTGTLASTITGTGVKKVRLMFERTILSVTVDGTLVFTHDDTYGPRPRVYSTTAGGFLNFFTDGGALKNLKIVNEKWMSDGTSNIAYVGGGEVAVGKALAFNRVSNVSQIKVDSNVVAEYTGPHDRPLRKYPEVELDVNAMTSPGVGGYIVTQSGQYSGAFAGWTVFGEEFTTTNAEGSGGAWIDGSPGSYAKEAGETPNGVVGSVLTTVQNAGTLKLASNTPVGAWVSLELPTSIKLQRIEMRPRLQHASETDLNEVALQSFPREFGIWGYDGSNWVLLKSVTGHSAGSAFGYTPTHVNATTAYNKYAIVVTRTNAVGGSNSDDRNFTAIGQLYFYGYEEGSGSLDTTLKSVYNVPATTGTQLEVYYDAKDLTTMPSTLTDLAGGDQNGAVTGVTLDTTGGIKSFLFDSSSEYISGTLPSTATGNWVHTISTWVNLPQIPTSGNYLFNAGIQPSSSSPGESLVIYIRQAGVYFDVGYESYRVDTLTPGQWSHISAVYTGGTLTSGVSIYINGVLKSQTDTSGSTQLNLTTQDFKIGASANGGSQFNGSIANFRLYSKALNADQVKELYDYQKDYFLGSKSQLTIYKGHLGVGVTEPSGQLELAGDERIQEYPPRGMTGYSTHIEGHGVFEVSASSKYTTADTFVAWKAFDKTEGTFWVSDDTDTPETYDQTTGLYTGTRRLSEESVLGEYIILKLPYSINLKSFTIEVRSTELLRGPKSGIVYGRKNNKWEAVHSFSGVTYTSSSVRQNIQVTHPNEYYDEFALVTTALAPNGSTYHNINLVELKYFGTPGPTTLDKGSLSLGRSLDVPRVSRYDVDTETPRPEKLVVDFDTTVNSSPTDISGRGNHGVFNGTDMNYSSANKAFVFNGTDDYIDIPSVSGVGTGAWVHSKSFWFNLHSSTEPGILFLLGRNGSTRQIAVQVNGSGQFQYFIYGCNSRVQVNGSDWYPDVNRWYHCVTVFRNNETTAGGSVLTGREMYIDGVKQTLVATGNQIALDLDSSEVRFGNQFNSNYLTYELSNPKLYNVALEPSEVQKLYRLGRTGRSMVISDTAVGIGKVPEAQLDVRGSMIVRGHADFNFAYRELHMYSKPDVYIYNSSGTALTLPYNAGGKYLFFRFPNYYSKNFEPIIASDYRYYVPENGLYFVRFTPLGGGTLAYEWFINKNRNSRGNTLDINYLDGFGPYAYANGVASATLSAIIPMTTTDYITFGVYTNSTNFDMNNRSSACITLIQRF
jgi:hypothetical protein